MKTPMLLGIDGGGTSTVALLADLDGTVLASGRSGPSNCRAIGMKPALEALDQAIALAFAKLDEPVRSLECACLGLAGFGRPEEQATLREWADQRGLTRKLLTITDGDLVVAAGTSEGWGVGVIAGTGSIAVGRNREGQSSRSGGWGPLLGDEGSAYRVVLDALRRIARRADGRERTGSQPDILTRHFFEALDLSEASGLVPAVYGPGVDRTIIAGWAPIVLAAAAEDLSVAADLLDPAGRDLGDMVMAVARSLGIVEGKLPLALAGGFLLSARQVESSLVEHLRNHAYEPEPVRVTEPAEGAVILARRAL
ncbi:N-acetylglucosamine kinase [Singulisphaera sp. PoT]|uniref:N-acetylglucosamine kinase n=1 Tax=Singulisphaera sp. PoT TaxID=3411797 RepID=UPI003BF55CA5